jgi:hypothetical protein
MRHFPLFRSGSSVSLLALALSISACSGGSPAGQTEQQEQQPPGGERQEQPGAEHPGQRQEPGPDLLDPNAEFLFTSTISKRVSLPLAAPGAVLKAEALAHQLAGYDPGSLLRCQLGGEDAFGAAVNLLGGVRWGYAVGALEDQSKPRFLAGFQTYDPSFGAPAAAPNEAASVEIVLPDIVAVTESAALFYSQSHGLMLVSIADGQPSFQCATPLPGNVDQFFYRDGHLVAMTQAPGGRSALLHFRVNGTQLSFVEHVDLGQVTILDSRRFNDQLVFYTDLRPGAAAQPLPLPSPTGGAPIAAGIAPGHQPSPPVTHRALRVFQLGDALQERMSDTLLDTTPSDAQLLGELSPETPVDTLVSESERFGHAMWASDHYFVVTQELSKTYLESWNTRSYSVCSQSHEVESPYQHCWTQFETRPNPDYTPPENSGGDRGCQGTTLSDCLTVVARALRAAHQP